MPLPALTDHFARLFSAHPRVFRAPGRVNLIGEHTDYNDGFVMPTAIAFSTYVAISSRPDRKLVIHSQEFPGAFEFDLDHLPQQRAGSWCDYVVGVAVVLRQHGHKLAGANLLVHGEVPVGAGLSSSAAIEVASALALMSLTATQLPLPEVAQLCREAENNFVGARVGIMDQFVSCMGKAGHAIFLDCRSRKFTAVPIPANLKLVVCNTMVKHDLATGAYNTRRAECEEGVRYFAKWDSRIRALRDVSAELLEQRAADLPATILKRCTHVIHENQRTLDAARCLENGDVAGLRNLMRESHRSLRDLYEVSCDELDIMVEAAEDLPGFRGGRMTGGGFGGCTVNLVREQNAAEFAERISERFLNATKINPNVYICSAEDGAQEISCKLLC
jgi:galactokinase